MTYSEEHSQAFKRILGIMEDLREKCPWDKKQTLESLRILTIEETYELSDAILKKDMEEMKKELGDLLLHVVFYSKIASETQDFTIVEVINTLCDKLIRRHPHIYGDTKVQSEEEVKQNWEKLKLAENKGEKGLLSGVPQSLPAMIKALRIQQKAKGVGFDWDNKEQVWEKVQEELKEFKEASSLPNAELAQEEMELEFGDLLFSLINYARFVKIDPESALEKTNRKFMQRFAFLEEESKKDGKKLEDMSLEEMDYYWNKAKSTKRT